MLCYDIGVVVYLLYCGIAVLRYLCIDTVWHCIIAITMQCCVDILLYCCSVVLM